MRKTWPVVLGIEDWGRGHELRTLETSKKHFSQKERSWQLASSPLRSVLDIGLTEPLDKFVLLLAIKIGNFLQWPQKTHYTCLVWIWQIVKKAVSRYFHQWWWMSTNWNADFQALHLHIRNLFNKKIEGPCREPPASFKNIWSWTSPF